MRSVEAEILTENSGQHDRSHAGLRGAVLPVIASLAVAAAIIAAAWPPASAPIFEGHDYLRIAEGHLCTAYNFYAGRVLHPLAAHALVVIARVSYADAFALVAVISLCLLVVASELFLLRHHRKAGWYLLPMLATPVLLMTFQLDYFPDLFHSALCAAFFLLFDLNAWISLPVLTLLHITRESSILLTGVVVILSAAAGRRWLAAGAFFCGAVGMAVSTALVSMGLPNKHGLPTPVYDILKVLYNVVHLFGPVFLTDTDVSSSNGRPLWSIHAHFGSIHQIGLYGFDFQYTIRALICVALAFGIMPVYLLHAKPRLETLSIKVAYWYGLLCVIAAFLIGNWTSRYILYAWPLFWLVGPVALATESNSTAIAILTVSMISCWIPIAGSVLCGHSWIGQNGIEFYGWPNLLASLGLEALVYLGTFYFIKNSRRRVDLGGETRLDLPAAP